MWRHSPLPKSPASHNLQKLQMCSSLPRPLMIQPHLGELAALAGVFAEDSDFGGGGFTAVVVLAKPAALGSEIEASGVWESGRWVLSPFVMASGACQQGGGSAFATAPSL